MNNENRCRKNRKRNCKVCPYKTLADLPLGGQGVVEKLLGHGPVRRRIMDMGITKGVNVKFVKAAPLGDPIELLVRGYKLSLRLEDARKIRVE
ncbi:MAG: ferrous iron transport protein A [Tissierellia bacterium]|jgi:ferrous iron transport protein A|nr:ferrous iron transport protein A [Tissierellia bacterium]